MATFNYDPRTAAFNNFQTSMIDIEKFRNSQAKAYFDAALAVDTQNRQNALDQDSLDNNVVNRRIGNANALGKDYQNNIDSINSDVATRTATDDYRDMLAQTGRYRASTANRTAELTSGIIGGYRLDGGQVINEGGFTVGGFAPGVASDLTRAEQAEFRPLQLERLKQIATGQGSGVPQVVEQFGPPRSLFVPDAPPVVQGNQASTGPDALANYLPRYTPPGLPVQSQGVGPGARNFPAIAGQAPVSSASLAQATQAPATIERSALQNNPQLRAAQIESISKKMADIKGDYEKVTAYGAQYPEAEKIAVIREYNALLNQQLELSAMERDALDARLAQSIGNAVSGAATSIGDYLEQGRQSRTASSKLSKSYVGQ